MDSSTNTLAVPLLLFTIILCARAILMIRSNLRLVQLNQ